MGEPPTKGWQKAHCGAVLEGVRLNFLFLLEIRIIATHVTWDSPIRTFVFNNARRSRCISGYGRTEGFVEEDKLVA